MMVIRKGMVMVKSPVILAILAGTSLALALSALRPAVVRVVVAQKDIPMGTTLREPEAFFKLCERYPEDVPQGAFTTLKALKDEVLKSSVRPGQIVTSDKILHAADRPCSGLAPGFRAIGIRIVNPSHRLRTGSIVHICHQKKDANSFETFVQNVSIIAIDGAVVTLAMLQEDAIKMVVAKESGTVYLKPRARFLSLYQVK